MRRITCICGQCATCRNREWNRRWREPVGLEELARRRREQQKSEAARKARRLALAGRDKMVHRAHSKVQKALKSGRLVAEPCAVCSSKDVQAHHEDYSKPFDVVWLCRPHHIARHMEIDAARLKDTA